MKYTEERLYIAEKIKQAYAQLTDGAPKTVEQKSEFDLVTEVDKNIEAFLISAILQKYPSDNIVSEETRSKSLVNGRTWIIDPIDGTCNFAHGISIYGVQLALCDGGRPVMAVMYLPKFNETFYATEGEGAFINDVPTHVSSDTKLQNAIIDLGEFSHRFPDLAETQLKFVNIIRNKVGKIRILGSACADFCFVAAGRTDAYVIMTDNLWDLVPGLFLTKEAGASVSNLSGEEYRFGDNGVVVASSPALHDLLISALKQSR